VVLVALVLLLEEEASALVGDGLLLGDAVVSQ
jgi:hypothetical protein